MTEPTKREVDWETWLDRLYDVRLEPDKLLIMITNRRGQRITRAASAQSAEPQEAEALGHQVWKLDLISKMLHYDDGKPAATQMAEAACLLDSVIDALRARLASKPSREEFDPTEWRVIMVYPIPGEPFNLIGCPVADVGYSDKILTVDCPTELLDRPSREEEMREAISVNDRLPEKDGSYLAYAPRSFPKNSRWVVAEFYDDNNTFYSESGDEPMPDVTHWSPLPAEPGSALAQGGARDEAQGEGKR